MSWEASWHISDWEGLGYIPALGVNRNQYGTNARSTPTHNFSSFWLFSSPLLTFHAPRHSLPGLFNSFRRQHSHWIWWRSLEPLSSTKMAPGCKLSHINTPSSHCQFQFNTILFNNLCSLKLRRCFSSTTRISASRARLSTNQIDFPEQGSKFYWELNFILKLISHPILWDWTTIKKMFSFSFNM